MDSCEHVRVDLQPDGRWRCWRCPTAYFVPVSDLLLDALEELTEPYPRQENDRA